MIDTSNYVTLQEILGITVNSPITIQGATVVVPAGYRLTSSRVGIAPASDLSSTTITAQDVLSGKLFYNSQGMLTQGTMLTVSATLQGGFVQVPKGYIATSQSFPVSGGIDISDTTAQAADVLAGKTFYTSGGIKTSGTIQTVSASVTGGAVVVPPGYIPTSQSFPISSGGVDFSSVTATTSTVVNGALFYDSNGELAEGNMPFMLGQEIIPATSSQIISGGLFLAEDITVLGDVNLVGSNIASGVTIFGVNGTAITGGVDVSDTTAMPMDVRAGAVFYDAEGTRTSGTIPSIGAYYITPTTSDQEIPDGVYIDGGIVVSGDANLLAANIVSGVTIFNVTGTFTQDANAQATDILQGRTAYVKGSKVTGTRSPVIPYVLFVSNDQAFNGNYIATSDSFNNAPVYELTQ